MSLSEQVTVLGVGMVPFAKPGRSDTYDVMGASAARLALEDAGIAYADVEQAFVGYVFGDSTCGQAALYKTGLTGIPVVNVNNNCATGSSALWLARQAIASGAADCVLALGFEQMERGALGARYTDRPPPFQPGVKALAALHDFDPAVPVAAQLFGAAGREFAERFGVSERTFAEISVKARKHAARNPYALFRDPVTVEEVLASPRLYGPLTRLQSCPPTCGAAAVVLCNKDFATSRGRDATVAITGLALRTDTESSFEDASMTKIVGYDMAVAAAEAAYAQAGVEPSDIDVVELHDCFTANELLSYEALGLTPEGTAEKFVADGDNTYGGRVVTNPSGGLLSKGHPLGATGLAQATELVWQLRGTAGDRQVEGARIGVQHNIGLGGACVVGVYERTDN